MANRGEKTDDDTNEMRQTRSMTEAKATTDLVKMLIQQQIRETQHREEERTERQLQAQREHQRREEELSLRKQKLDLTREEQQHERRQQATLYQRVG